MFEARRMAILAEGKLGVLTSKTAACMVRYQPERVVCIIDSTKQGLSVNDVLGFGRGIPVVGSLEEAALLSPDTLLIGIAPRGGALPQEWRHVILDAVERGLNLVSGLHTMLEEDPEISQAARAKKVAIWDIRKPVYPSDVSRGLLRQKAGTVILTVGSDCRTGKMTVSYELTRFLRASGLEAEFVPTGQTGILLAGWGVAVDRVPGDFMSRVTEDLTLRALEHAKIAVVEGQGSMIHPGYSGVSLAIMHGCCPDLMILCHDPARAEIEGYGMKIPPLSQLVRLYEEASAPVLRSRVVAVALNTYRLSEEEARRHREEAQQETGLPVGDVVRWGCEDIYRSLGRLV